MFLGFLKRTAAKEKQREERTRTSDGFERHLRLALHGRDLVIHGPATLHNLLALTIPAGSNQGRTEKVTSMQVDYAVLDERTREPVLGVILTSRGYGRDRRGPPPAPVINGTPRTITPILHLNPNLLTDVLAVRMAVQPFLPD